MLKFQASCEEEMPRERGNAHEAEHHNDEIKELNKMLLRKQTLSPQARQAFSLMRDPFAEVQRSEDLYISPEIRYVRESLYQVTRYGIFMAIVGESGSGKSTLRKDLHARLRAEDKPVLIIEPYVVGMEDNDIKGHTLKSSAIADAILAAVAPGCKVPRGLNDRYRAVHEALRESHKTGFRHVLIIEEAHAIPIATLKHLKRFFELEEGFEKLLSVVLIGQPELAYKLSENRAEVREVVQRCEVVQLNPLDQHLGAYLNHRFKQVGVPLERLMDEAAIEALRAKLTGSGGKSTYSVLYPLAVHNLLTAALNLAAQVAAPRLTPEIIAEV